MAHHHHDADIVVMAHHHHDAVMVVMCHALRIPPKALAQTIL
jgi:hypothetical protein